MNSNTRVTSINLWVTGPSKIQVNSLMNYLGFELTSVADLSLSEETCKVWVKAVSFILN